MKKLLITGGTGFIGRHCLQILSASREYEIHATYHGSNIEGLSNVTWHKIDLLQSDAVSSLLSEIRPTHLLHLAWYAVPGKYLSSKENFKWVSSSLALLHAFSACGGERCVFAGTCAEYDWQYGYCSEELTPCKPATIYGTCKHSLQLMIDAFCKDSGLSSAWGRIFFLYGPYEPEKKLVSSVIASLLNGKQASCSHGTQIRDFLYVQDVAAAFIALLGREVRGVVNISSGNPVVLKDIILSLAEMLRGQDLIQFGAIPVSKNEPDLLVGNNRRLIEGTGWRPEYNLRSGLELTVNSWKERLNI